MSPRAACRLATLGFEQLYDYVGGKADWLAQGMALEGDEPPRTAAALARDDVVTCGLTDAVDGLREATARSPYAFAVVTGKGGVVLGRLELEGDETGRRAEEVMKPGPWTVRPAARLDWLAERMRRRGAATVLVTTPDGRLVGVVRRDDLAT
jgi:CBS domain-containing protein